jgi:dihydroorotase
MSIKTLVQSAKIIDPRSVHNGKITDILIKDDTIMDIGESISAAGIKNRIKVPGLHVSPGWFDMQVHFCDPGYEYKEDLLTGMKAAAAGGITGVLLSPATHPPVYTKSQVEYIKRKTAGNAVDVFSSGVISFKLEEKELSEMYDMKQAGAMAFTDDIKPVMNAGLLLRALLYTKSFDGLIITRCNDATLTTLSCVNEGETSLINGIRGEPGIAEEIMVVRDLYLASYAGNRLHINSVSLRGSVEQIRKAKMEGIAVTASVNAYNLCLDDSMINNVDTNLKVSPPLRSKEDIKALKKALSDNTIDVICSDHRPEEEESKKLEFELASPGMTGIQTLYPLVNMYSNLSHDKIIEKISIRPREILGLPVPVVEEGEKANLTFFNPGLNWTYRASDIYSLSKNTPFLNKLLKGKALGIYNHGIYQPS